MTKGKRNANGLGHTYKVGNSYKTVIRRDGQTYTATASTQKDSRQKAMSKADGMLQLARKKVDEKIPLENFLMNWLENQHRFNIAHSTYLRYRSLAIHHINPKLGRMPIAEISAREITELLSVMRQKGQSSRSMQQARAVLSICLTEAENLDYIPANPVRKVKNPQNSERNFSPLTLDEVKRLLKTYEGTYLCARLHLALLCGLRQGEALGLQWQDVDFKSGTINIKSQIQIINGKQAFTSLKTTRSKRTVVLTANTLQALVEHRLMVERWVAQPNYQGGEWDLVFPRPNGTPRSPQTDYDEWQKALKLCGISPRRLHDARHTAATLMYSQQVGIETISRALGHSSSAITSRLYVHSAEEPLRLAAESISRALSEPNRHA